MSYYRLKDYNKAIEYLKDFSSDAKQVQAVAYGSIGDAYSELKKNDEAIEYYKKQERIFQKMKQFHLSIYSVLPHS